MGHLEKPVSLAFRGALRDLSIGGRVNNQRITLQLIMSLPPNPHPVEVFRCALWANVFQKGGLKSGETILIHGGSSGIGTTAIQLASYFGAQVVTTAGSDEKCKFCQELGAVRSVNYRKEDFVEVVAELTKGNGVDLILDMVGGSYVERNFQALAVEGRLVQIAFLHASKITMDLMPIMQKRLNFTGSTLRPRTVAQKGAIANELSDKVWPLLKTGKVRPIIHKTFPLPLAADAHRLMESSAHIGKIILTT